MIMTTASYLSISAFLLRAAPMVALGAGCFFWRRQNNGRAVGGAISLPKSLWLSYTVIAWFFLPFVFLPHPDLTYELKLLLLLHLGSWWIRGPLELLMIYRWFNWSPRYGIAHDLLHAAMLGTGLVLLRHSLFLHPVNRLAALFLAVTLLATWAETFFAWLFLSIRGHEDHKVYFADNDPKWRLNNRGTAMMVLIVYGHLVFQAVKAWR